MRDIWMLKQFNLVSLLSDEEKEKDTNVAQYFVYLIMYIGLLLHLLVGMVLLFRINLTYQTQTTFLVFALFQFYHTKGRFWPKNKMDLQGKVPIGWNKSVEIFLEYEIVEKIKQKDQHCTKVNFE